MKPILVITLNPAVDVTYTADTIAVGTVNRVHEVYRVPGGKGINVLRVMKALGRDAVGCGFLAGDAGRWMTRRLTEEGIVFHPWMVEGETRSTVTVVQNNRDESTELVEPGPVIQPDDAVKVFERLPAMLTPGQYVALSGSQPQGLPADYTARLVELAVQYGCTTCVDVSGATLEHVLDEHRSGRPDIVKVNLAELTGWLGVPVDVPRDVIAKGAERLLQRGLKLVVVTMGSLGCLAISPNDRWSVGSPPVEAKSPVGSGDAFFAGLLVALAGGMSELDALVLAAACGASNARHLTAGVIDLSDVAVLSRQVDVSPVEM